MGHFPIVPLSNKMPFSTSISILGLINQFICYVKIHSMKKRADVINADWCIDFMKYSHEGNIHNIAIFIKYHFKYSLILHVGNHISVKLLVANVPTRCVLQWNVHTLEKERFKKCSIKNLHWKVVKLLFISFFVCQLWCLLFTTLHLLFSNKES